MSEETKEAPASNGVTQHNVVAESAVPQFRLTEERTKREEAARSRDQLSKQLEALRAEHAAAQKELQGMRSQHQQEMYLVEQGFKAPSVRRFFRREYNDAVSELPTDNRPTFEAWLSANQDDPLYSVHFNRLNQSTATAEQGIPETQPVADMGADDQLLDRLRAALTGNPDAGASQPRDHKKKEWTSEEIRKLRAKNKPQGSSRGKLPNSELQQILAEWRSKGMIK